jgi:cytosine/adenosine deaminase-related metal-dependent hydrolase
MRASTSDLWQAVRDAAASQGFELTGVNAVDMGQLRAFAVANRNAAEAFNSAVAGTSLDAGMMGQELYYTASNRPDSLALYNVRFMHTVIEDGVEIDLQRTDQIRGILPATKDQLMQMLDSDAQILADEYNQSHVSIGDVTISLAE